MARGRDRGGAEQDPGPGTAVATNAILPDLSDDDLAAGTTRVMAATGCRTVKLKVGGRPTGAELARVTTVMQAAAAVVPDARLRLDGNGRFDFAAAQEFLVALTWSDAAVEYVEQPCRSVDEMRLLKEHVPDVALAADESLRRDRHFHDLAEIADVAIVKVAPLGGPRAVRSVLADIDLPVVVSGAAESSVGLSRDAVVAAQVGAPRLGPRPGHRHPAGRRPGGIPRHPGRRPGAGTTRGGRCGAFGRGLGTHDGGGPETSRPAAGRLAQRAAR